MADTLTAVSSNPGVNKIFALSTTNTLSSSRANLDYAQQYTPQYGRVFTPNTVVISYLPYTTLISVSTVGVPGDGTFGSVTYYDPSTVPANTNQYKFGAAWKTIDKMPSWLFVLVSPNI